MNIKEIKPKVWINIGLVVILLIFVLQNLDTHQVRFLFFRFNLPIFVIILVSFFIGFYTSFFKNAFGKKKEDAKEQEEESR